MTPTVARTLIRVDSSACGIVPSFDRAHGQAAVRLVVQAYQDLEAPFAQAVVIRPALHQRVHLLTEDANSGERLRPRLDLSAAPRQDLSHPRIEEIAVGVGPELGGIQFGLNSEGPHIFVPHYPIPQQKTQTGGCGELVTLEGSAAPARRCPLLTRRPTPAPAVPRSQSGPDRRRQHCEPQGRRLPQSGPRRWPVPWLAASRRRRPG